jgi:hypothetical protein
MQGLRIGCTAGDTLAAAQPRRRILPDSEWSSNQATTAMQLLRCIILGSRASTRRAATPFLFGTRAASRHPLCTRCICVVLVRQVVAKRASLLGPSRPGPCMGSHVARLQNVKLYENTHLGPCAPVWRLSKPEAGGTSRHRPHPSADRAWLLASPCLLPPPPTCLPPRPPAGQWVCAVSPGARAPAARRHGGSVACPTPSCTTTSPVMQASAHR